MCGIGGAINLDSHPIQGLQLSLQAMNILLSHRGPDGHGSWVHPRGHVGFMHRRLSIIDLSAAGNQPMVDENGNWISFNGEIYNYIELRAELGRESFRTNSDTEVILRSYQKWGVDCVHRFRGMFAFALWHEASHTLLCARDRFGIKPLYYTLVGRDLFFASEAKALLPFVEQIETDTEGLKDYLAFQFCLSGKTLFKGVHELLPGHLLHVSAETLRVQRYWEVYYNLDFDHTAKYFEERLRELMQDSVSMHLRSDVPVGAYLSGGLDSSIVTALAARSVSEPMLAFNGRFMLGPEYDESHFARALAKACDLDLRVVSISSRDFVDQIRNVIYHLDYPVAGPGSFPQFIVSAAARRHRKVVLGGQGGDEIFGGYTRYLLAYFEQCIKAAIDATTHTGNFIVTYESIIPNLTALKGYKPLLQEFWREGLFDEMDRRYFRLINRASQLGNEVDWHALGEYSPYETFRSLFYSENVGKQSYFDLMTHFDFKTLLPALLQVEDRVSMAHGLESRVPMLDHPIVEFAATIPSNVKFKNGTMKHVLKNTFGPLLPAAIAKRQDKMGFPTPFAEWIVGDAKEFVHDTLSAQTALARGWIDNQKVLDKFSQEAKYGRNLWGLLSLEIWQQEFHDQAARFQRMPSKLEDRA